MLEEELPDLDMSSALTLLGEAITQQVLDALQGTGLRPGHGYLIQRLLIGPATATEISGAIDRLLALTGPGARLLASAARALVDDPGPDRARRAATTQLRPDRPGSG